MCFCCMCFMNCHPFTLFVPYTPLRKDGVSDSNARVVMDQLQVAEALMGRGGVIGPSIETDDTMKPLWKWRVKPCKVHVNCHKTWCKNKKFKIFGLAAQHDDSLDQFWESQPECCPPTMSHVSAISVFMTLVYPFWFQGPWLCKLIQVGRSIAKGPSCNGIYAPRKYRVAWERESFDMSKGLVMQVEYDLKKVCTRVSTIACEDEPGAIPISSHLSFTSYLRNSASKDCLGSCFDRLLGQFRSQQQAGTRTP